MIRRIRYDGIHSISESDILDRFKDRKVGLTVESQFDPTRIKKAEVVLKDLLGEHGRQFAKVTPQYEKIASSNAVILVFKIEEGPKVKVGQIHFTGNHAFSDRKLIRAMRHDRPYGIPLYFTEINVMSKTYDHEKLNRGYRSWNPRTVSGQWIFQVVVAQGSDSGERIGRLALRGFGSRARPHRQSGQHHDSHRRRRAIQDGDAENRQHGPGQSAFAETGSAEGGFPSEGRRISRPRKLRKALENYTDSTGSMGLSISRAEPDSDLDDAAKKIDLTMKFDEQKAILRPPDRFQRQHYHARQGDSPAIAD